MDPSANTSSSDEVVDPKRRKRLLKLYRAALKGDWGIAEGIYNENPGDIVASLSKEGDTALHIAAAAERTDFVEKQLSKMTEEDVTIKNVIGNTAFCLAAASGNEELARMMLEKNKDLIMIRGNREMLPVKMAALLGHENMALYLYNACGDDLKDIDRVDLLVTLINNDFYDAALQLVEKHRNLATLRPREHGITALHALAQKPLTSHNFSGQNEQGIFSRCFNLFSGTNLAQNKKMHPKAVKLVQLLWEQIVLLNDLEISDLIRDPWRLIFVAAEHGNVEFLSILIQEYPALVFKVDENKYSIFHIAVLNRHEDVFKLIYEIGSIKDLIIASEDGDEHNILHLAGILAPPSRLNIVSGAALQLQRELMWFKEVSKFVQPCYAEGKNKNSKTPRALFTAEHTELTKKGEKWMKETASSCMIVATLIATVVFAAAFTVPGGIKGDTGAPNFLGKASFVIFAVSDAIALLSSTCSILIFLSILTARYAEEDFLWLLPTKLVLGLSALFVSIGTMMIVFCATFFMVFNEGMLGVAVLVTALASVPVFLFIWQYYHIFVDVVRSTYISNSLFNKRK